MRSKSGAEATAVQTLREFWNTLLAHLLFPATRRASRALRERLEQKKIRVIYTRTAGAVKIETDKAGWKLETMDGQKYTHKTH